uniref:Uncharacterized protein n=1 Tax=Ditylenchus dipsaci TaxID=166011 RepID=A0A915EB44_9BILA
MLLTIKTFLRSIIFLSAFIFYMLLNQLVVWYDFSDKLPLKKTFQNEQSLPQTDISMGKMCDDELMVYENSFRTGIKFDCSLLAILKVFGLDQNSQLKSFYAIDDLTATGTVNFVLAADINYYKSVRAVISTIQKNFKNHRIILYDLGGIAQDIQKVQSQSIMPQF